MPTSVKGDLRFASPEELTTWTERLEQLPGGGEIWQSQEYAETKRYQRYVDRYVVGDDFPATLILEKRVPLLGRWWYVPAGPVAENVEATLEAAQRLADFARTQGAFLLKIEPRVAKTPEAMRLFEGAGFQSVVRVLPNESTILLDISGEESEVMLRFSSSTRTKIRRADKVGFETRRVDVTDENCRIMYDLLGETGDGKFQLRPYEYYRNFWRTLQNGGRGQLVLGYHEGEAVAGMFGIVLGRTSGYKDGASTKSRHLPNGAMYRMQWELILWGRERGAVIHDLVGSPPSDQVDDTGHPLYGVGQYKLRLSKEVTDYVGALDLPLRGLKAKLWNAVGDRLARRWSLAVRKDPYY